LGSHYAVAIIARLLLGRRRKVSQLVSFV